MRLILVFLCGVCLFSACKKGDGSNAPEIKFKDILEVLDNTSGQAQPNPILTIQVKDIDGDIGFNGADTSFIFIKNISIPPFKSDSFAFPTSLSTLPKTTFTTYLDVQIDLNGSRTNGAALVYQKNSGASGIKRDTMYYEVYIKDFAKHKSNVIKTDKPLLYINP